MGPRNAFPRRGASERTRNEVDFILGLIRAALMVGFVVAAIVVLACLFMIVFGIATGIDRRIQD